MKVNTDQAVAEILITFYSTMIVFGKRFQHESGVTCTCQVETIVLKQYKVYWVENIKNESKQQVLYNKPGT